MATAVCTRCGRSFMPDDESGTAADALPDTLADLGALAPPPEAAAALAGATPFDARLGTDSGPVEYGAGDEQLCPACRAEAGEGGAQ